MKELLIKHGAPLAPDNKKSQKVKFVIPTDERIIDPKTKSIRWRLLFV